MTQRLILPVPPKDLDRTLKRYFEVIISRLESSLRQINNALSSSNLAISNVSSASTKTKGVVDGATFDKKYMENFETIGNRYALVTVRIQYEDAATDSKTEMSKILTSNLTNFTVEPDGEVTSVVGSPHQYYDQICLNTAENLSSLNKSWLVSTSVIFTEAGLTNIYIDATGGDNPVYYEISLVELNAAV